MEKSSTDILFGSSITLYIVPLATNQNRIVMGLRRDEEFDPLAGTFDSFNNKR